MEMVWFTLVAVVLYLASDRILNALEVRAGRRFEYRSLWFFGLLLALALVTFAAVRKFIYSP